jgi:O-antigen/teichoic acid export membrane protein
VRPAPTAKRNLLGGAVLFLLARGAGVLAGLGVTLVLARSLSRADFGTFSLGMTMVVLGTALGDGLGGVLMRESIKTPADEADLAMWARRFWFCAAGTAALAVAGASFFLVSVPSHRLALVLLGLALPLLAPTVLYTVLQRRYLAGRMALLMLLQNAQWLAVVSLLALLGAPLVAYAVAYPLTSLLYSLEMAVAARRVLGPPGRRIGARSAARRLAHAIPVSMTAMVAIAYSKVDGVLLYLLQGAAASAGYVAAYRLLDVAQLVPASLGSVFYPLFNYAWRDKRSPEAVAARWIHLSIMIAAPAVVLAEMLAGPVVRLVFGPGYADSELLFRLLMPSFILICPGWVLTSVAVSAGRARRQLQLSGAGLAVTLVANLALIPVWGAVGCCIATLLTEVAVFGMSWAAVRGIFQGPVWPSWNRLARLALLLGIAAAPAILLPPIAAAVMFALCFGAGALLLRLVTIDDYRLVLPETEADRPA